MAKRVSESGRDYKVAVGQDEIDEFRDQWPGAGMSTLRSINAEFDKESGDLIDLNCNGRHGCSRWDGDALLALVGDMQCLGQKKIKPPHMSFRNVCERHSRWSRIKTGSIGTRRHGRRSR